MARKLWSINALAAELDFDRRTVTQRLAKIAPDGEVAGHPAWFILTAIRALWPAANASGEILDPAQERALKDRALREKTELENATTRGELVAIDEVGSQVERLFGVIRERFLGMPGKMASVLTPQQIGSLDAEVREVLLELSSPEDLSAVREAKGKRDANTRRRVAEDARTRDGSRPGAGHADDQGAPRRASRPRQRKAE